MDEMFTRVFGEHPYSHPFLGDAEETKRLNGTDCAAWYESLIVPASVVVSIVGDIDTKRARGIAEDLYGDLAPGPVRSPDFTAPVAPASAAMAPGATGGLSASAGWLS